MLELGFPPLVVVAGRVSVADLYPSRSQRCGIYVLEHSDGMHYVGQAVDVVRRFAQHRKASPDIERLSFFQVGRHELDAVERRCIHSAEVRGLRLRNRMLVKQLSGESDLDDVLRPDEQLAWLEDPSAFGSEPRLRLDPDQVQRLRVPFPVRALQEGWGLRSRHGASLPLRQRVRASREAHRAVVLER